MMRFFSWALTTVIVNSMLCAEGCSQSNSALSPSDSGPVVDMAIGMAEKAVLRRYGAPHIIEVKQAKAMLGELRSSLQAKVPNDETEIKELYYKSPMQEQIFWLTLQSDGEWRVVSDVRIPKGTSF